MLSSGSGSRLGFGPNALVGTAAEGEGTDTPNNVFGLGSGVTAISAGFGAVFGSSGTCAIHNGAVKCWGDYINDFLGVPDLNASAIPRQLLDLEDGVTAIAVGHTHACAIRNKEMWCWGDGAYRQLGRGDSGSRAERPIKIPQVAGVFENNNVTAITAGDIHTCAIENSAVFCWGATGVGPRSSVDGAGFEVGRAGASRPHPVAGLEQEVTAIATAHFHTCAIKAGAVFCWGRNNFGVLGSTANNTFTPTLVPGLDSGVTAITVGGGIPTRVASIMVILVPLKLVRHIVGEIIRMVNWGLVLE